MGAHRNIEKLVSVESVRTPDVHSDMQENRAQGEEIDGGRDSLNRFRRGNKRMNFWNGWFVRQYCQRGGMRFRVEIPSGELKLVLPSGF